MVSQYQPNAAWMLLPNPACHFRVGRLGVQTVLGRISHRATGYRMTGAILRDLDRRPRFSGRGVGLRAIPPSSAGRAVARFRSWPGKLPD